jgi:uncharacterized protein YndB with AHSA1/START domain
MESKENAIISVHAIINAPIEKVWKLWTTPEDIEKWNSASDDWHTTSATNELKKGGKFIYRMEAVDGSMGFDFEGVYTAIKHNELIEYVIVDGRHVRVDFTFDGNETVIVETFEAEGTHPVELQRDGWQSIVNNFKKYVESYSK